MKKLTKIVATVVACGALALALAGCGSSAPANNAANNAAPAANNAAAPAANNAAPAADGYKLVADGKLTIGTDFDYPPFTMLDDNSKPAGFEYGMMVEVCKRINLEPAYLSPQNFDTLITQVSGGATMDVAVSGITIDDERMDLVDFTVSYFDSNLAIVTLKDSGITGRADLKDKAVGGQSGTSGEAWVEENLPEAEYTPYTAITDALAALRAGKVVALVYDEPVAKAHVTGEYNDCNICDTIATGEQYGIAVNKENKALTEAISAAIESMKADGTMDKLLKEYFN